MKHGESIEIGVKEEGGVWEEGVVVSVDITSYV